MKPFLIVLFFISLQACEGLKILAVFPLPMKSHLKIGHSLADSLLNAGHEVTVITGSQDEKPRDNYRIIQYGDFLNKLKGVIRKKNLINFFFEKRLIFAEEEGNPFQFVNIPIFLSFLMMPTFTTNLVTHFMEESPEVKKFLEKDDEKFDVCLIEIFNVEALLVRIIKKSNTYETLEILREFLKNMIAFLSATQPLVL